MRVKILIYNSKRYRNNMKNYAERLKIAGCFTINQTFFGVMLDFTVTRASSFRLPDSIPGDNCISVSVSVEEKKNESLRKKQREKKCEHHLSVGRLHLFEYRIQNYLFRAVAEVAVKRTRDFWLAFFFFFYCPLFVLLSQAKIIIIQHMDW